MSRCKRSRAGLTPTTVERRLAKRLAEKTASYLDKGWTRLLLAANAEGEEVLPSSKAACCWCLEGAVAAAFNMEMRQPQYKSSDRHLSLVVARLLLCEVLRNSLPKGFRRKLHTWNDRRGRTKREVITLVEHARLYLSELATVA